MQISRFLTIPALALGIVLTHSPMTGAEEAQGKDLGAIVGELLRGSQDAQPERRVPFGRQQMQLSYAPLVKATAPAVVNVYASTKVRSPFAGDPFFERFFGQQMAPRQQSSLGSGVIVDPSGIVVTNYHVIGDADQVKVALSDGREFDSKTVLKDQSLDLAILKIEAPQPFPVVQIGDSDALEVGDLVLAIGNPFGVGQTTTSGIISALARSHIGISDFGFFIQTDAAINPGNSGGGLINMQGELVGINTAIFSQSGGSVGIGFAIPSNMVRAVVDAAKSGRDFFERPYIGANFEPVTAQVAEALGMKLPTGALVTQVAADAPAAAAGLKPGDVVLALNGSPLEGPDALGYRLATQQVGTDAMLTVLRQGKEVELSIKLARAPEGMSTLEVTIGGQGPFSGTKVAALSPRLAQKLRLDPEAKGVVIVALDKNSPAAGVGFLPGDIVREVNGAEIQSADQLSKLAIEQSRWWRFTIERKGQVLRQVLRY